MAYLSRTDARRYQRRLLLRSTPLEVPRRAIGGPDKPTFGIILDCREVESLPTPTGDVQHAALDASPPSTDAGTASAQAR